VEVLEHLFLGVAYIAVIGFLISGLDDLLFDSGFLVYLFRRRKQPHLTLQQLKLAPEQWIALLVPAWQEGGVVNKMAEYAARVVLYEKYDIFIGVYPNDPETNKCVDEVVAANPRIHKVVVPHNGPSSKADCLNWIYRAMRANESAGVREYSVIAIHDAEDVIHPLVLKLYNYFIPRQYDMGQVPVFALEHPVWSHWVANTYIDDFAELHTKDLFVRETIKGVVPSAGVGTAFARLALDALAANNHDEPFRVGNLTEDYEVAIRMKRAGYRAGLINYPVDRIVRCRHRDGSLGPPETITEIVAVRETFPTTFSTAVRQRSRWILGIAFQTWEQAGWGGTWPMRYTLVRDRRAPLTHLLNMLGYIVLAYVLFQWTFRNTGWATNVHLRPLFQTDSLLWKITIIDTCLLGYRAVQKFISVLLIHNAKQAFASLPRVVVGNILNFAATMRATQMYLAHKLFKKPIVWHKTQHVFPDEAELREYTKTIEDLLVEEGLVTREQIFDALQGDAMGSTPARLLRMGLLEERDFTGVWAKHSRLPAQKIDPRQLSLDLLQKYPEQNSIETQGVPIVPSDGRLVMAFCEPPNDRQLSALHDFFRTPVRPVLAMPSNISLARWRAYPRTILVPSPLQSSLEKFQQAAGATDRFFLDAQIAAHRARQSLPDTMVDLGMLSEPEARRLWAEVVGFAPSSPAEASLDQQRYFHFGPIFWWLHRLLPLAADTVLSAAPPHRELMRLAPGNWLSVLPAKIDLLTRRLGIEMDPDKVLLDTLLAKGLLKPDQAPNLPALRGLVKDPLSKWLVFRGLLTEAQINNVFREISSLPAAKGWAAPDVRRLAPVLPPGFPEAHGVFCLSETENRLTIGLSQMPSTAVLRDIYDRLDNRPILFQALNIEDAQAIRALLQ
jgi:adsorption protein B